MLGHSALLAATNTITPGFGNRLAGITGGTEAFDIDFHAGGGSVAVALGTAGVTIVRWSRTTGSQGDYGGAPGLKTTADNVETVHFSSAGNSFTFSNDTFETAQGLFAYPWSSVSGYGTRYSALTYGLSSAFSTNEDALLFGSSNAVVAYRWSPVSGLSSPYTAPSGLPVGVSYIRFAPSGNAVAFAHPTSPFLSAYQWISGVGFGSKYSNPSPLPPISTDSRKLVFSPDGKALIICGRTSSSTVVGFRAYEWSDANGFGQAYANPATPLLSSAFGCDFSPSGRSVAIVGANGLKVYRWSSELGFGSEYTAPLQNWRTSNVNARAVRFSPQGDAIIIGHQALSGLTTSIYEWSD